MPSAIQQRAHSATENDTLHDLQSEPDHRAIRIDQVGIRNIQVPIQILDQEQTLQNTVGSFDIYVDLDKDIKGTHMSRFVEILNDWKEPFSVENVQCILPVIRQRLGSSHADLTMAFPYFREKSAPVSKQTSLMNYQIRFLTHLDPSGSSLTLEVQAPVKTLCPCSKSISKYGAHNQRGVVTVQVRSTQPIWIEELIRIIEASGSSELYALLKRPDEKDVTERAYENPVFVEDLVRNVVKQLKADNRISWYQVEAENHESIHNHNAYARIRKPE